MRAVCLQTFVAANYQGSTKMAETLNSHSSKKQSLNLVWLPVAAAFIAVSAYIAYFGVIKNLPQGGPDSWAGFGDFLGGILNPIVGIVTVVLLVRTLQEQQCAIDLQRDELAAQRHELELQREEAKKATTALVEQHEAMVRQSFEQAFFAWLQSYRQAVSELRFAGNSGPGALRQMIAYCRADHASMVLSNGREISDANPAKNYDQAIDSYEKYDDRLLVERFGRARVAYEDVYQSHHDLIGPLLRSIYRLIKWVDESKLAPKEKWHYVSIVRSQLAWSEMMLILYSGCTQQGQRFVALVNRYAILDNLEGQTDGLVHAMRTILVKKPCQDFPYKLSAFNSGVAKSQLGFVDIEDL